MKQSNNETIAVDYSLYLVTDEGLAKSKNRTTEEIVRQAIKGGVTVVQYRDKRKYEHASMDDPIFRSMVKKARKIHKITKEYGIPLIINDHIEVATTIDAEGVHVGQEDMSAKEVRKILGQDTIVGVSTHNPEQAKKAISDGVTYIGVGPVFPTKTKPDAKEIGLETLGQITKISTIPVVAIGGFTNEPRIRKAVMKGADGIACVRYLINCEDPKARASRIITVINNAR